MATRSQIVDTFDDVPQFAPLFKVVWVNPKEQNNEACPKLGAEVIGLSFDDVEDDTMTLQIWHNGGIFDATPKMLKFVRYVELPPHLVDEYEGHRV